MANSTQTIIITAAGAPASGKTLTLKALQSLLKAFGVKSELLNDRSPKVVGDSEILRIHMTAEGRAALGDLKNLLPTIN